MKPKVFLSSTFNDLVDLRASVAVALEYWGYEPIFFENSSFPKRVGLHPNDMCLEAVKECPLYILVIDKIYGSDYTGTNPWFSDISVTHAEAKTAFDSSLVIFPFVRRSTWEHWKAKAIPDGFDLRVLKFIDWVAKTHWIDDFQDVEELKRKLRPRLQQSDFAPDLVYGTPLDGWVIILQDTLISEKASHEEIMEFYNGEDINWKIIASEGNVSREQETGILEELEKTTDKFQILCIVGEPDLGKSTVAWKIAYKLRMKGKMVMHLCESNQAEFWYRLPEYYERLGTHFYVLVDDIFRSDISVQALQYISKHHDKLPITVIATSRSNEYISKNIFKRFIKRIDLHSLTKDEKMRYIEKLGKNYENLNSTERQYVDEADSPLVLGVELTGGKIFKEKIQEDLDLLKDNDGVVYRAYEYICFFYQYGISVPQELLDRLDNFGLFYNIIEHKASIGVLYEDKLRPGNIHAKRESIAQMAQSFYSRDPRVIYREVMDAIDEREWRQRRTLVHLTRQLIQDHDVKFSLDILKVSQDKIEKIILQSTISELAIWRSIYQRLDISGKAKNCADAILLLEPQSSLDCQLLINGFLEGKQLQKAISTAEGWLLANHNDSSIRTRHISLVEDNGTPEQANKVIEETRAWLLENEDSSVRTRYISLVDARGSDKQVEEVIDETEAWLLEKENSAVRTRHISLVRKKGSDEQLKRAIINSMIWLKDSNSDVFSAYLSLVRDRDFLDPEIIKRTLTNTEERMKKDKTQIDQLFLGYLSMVRKIRKTKIDVLVDIDLVKNFGYQYISSCNSLVPINDFARWLSEEKFFDDSIEIFDKLSKEETSSNKIKREIHFGFGMAYLGQAMNPHLADYQHLNALKKSEEQFRKVVRINKGDLARSYLAIVLREEKQFEEAAREFKHVEWWSRNGRYVPYSPGKLFSEIGKFYQKFNRYGEAIFWYEKAINEEPDVFANWWGLGRARMGMAEELIKQKKDIHAEKMLNRALKELETALEKSPRPLQLPASRDLPDQIAKCKKLYLLYKY